MDALVRRGHHLVQALHGLPRRPDARRRRASSARCCGAARRRHDLHARRERRRHRRARAARARGGAHGARSTTRSRARRARRPRRRTARSRSPRWPARPSTSSTSRPPRRSRRWRRRATAACPCLRRDLPAVPLPLVPTTTTEPGFEGAKYVMSPPLRPKGHAGAPLARPRVERPAGRLDRPLPVLHEGPEGPRPRTTSRRSRTACPASRRA